MTHQTSARLIGIAIAILVSITGCADQAVSLEQSNTDQPARTARIYVPDEKANVESPVTVVDRLGRTVLFKKSPRRIVSLSPSTTELMFAIHAGPQIVGATQHCDYPPQAAELPRVGGGTLESLSREKILELEPDLVLCKWDNHEPLMRILERVDIPVFAVGPESLAELYKEAVVLGKVTRREADAAHLVADMKRRVESLTSLVSSLPPESRRSVFYEVWDEPLMSAGPNSFIGELLQLAGTRNIFSDTDTRYPCVSAEVVVSRNPDVILSPTTHASKVSREKIFKRQGWSQVTAVQDKQVFLIDGDPVSRCGPRLVDALEEIIRVVYPERYRARRQSPSSVSGDENR